MHRSRVQTSQMDKEDGCGVLPAICPLAQASATAWASMIAPRALFTMRTPFFNFAILSLLNIPLTQISILSYKSTSSMQNTNQSQWFSRSKIYHSFRWSTSRLFIDHLRIVRRSFAWSTSEERVRSDTCLSRFRQGSKYWYWRGAHQLVPGTICIAYQSKFYFWEKKV